MYAKVNYGTSLKQALIEFNNTYHLPRVARTVKLIGEAQEASSQIHPVLSTAAETSENQDDIERERKARTRMQVAIIVMTYMTLLGVMALLQVQFIDVIADLTSQAAQAAEGGQSPSGGASFASAGADPAILSMLFFHAVSLQAIISSFIAGYIREVNLLAGMKFAVVLSTVALVAWIGVVSMGG
jgi:flagellar protein FlaJ